MRAPARLAGKCVEKLLTGQPREYRSALTNPSESPNSCQLDRRPDLRLPEDRRVGGHRHIGGDGEAVGVLRADPEPPAAGLVVLSRPGDDLRLGTQTVRDQEPRIAIEHGCRAAIDRLLRSASLWVP